LLDQQLQQWMKAAQAGDATAYHQVLEKSAQLTHKFLIKNGLEPIDADDVTQEVLIAIDKAKATYDIRYSFLGWMYAIVRFKLADFFRAKYKRESRTSDEDLELLIEEAQIEDQFTIKELREMIDTAMNGLSKVQKQIIIQMKFEGKSVKEIALQLKMSESAVKVSASRGYAKLKVILLKEHGIIRCNLLLFIIEYISRGN